MPRARPASGEAPVLFVPVGVGGELPLSCMAVAASPPQAGERGGFHPVKEAPRKARAKHVCSAERP